MLKLKVPAVIAAVLFMSVSAQAMEFDDLPVLISGISSPSTVRAMPSDDRSRRQIDSHVVLVPVTVAGTKLPDRPRPISNLIHTRVAHMKFEDRPDRLSAEFSAIVESSGIRFEHRPGVISNRFKPITTLTALRFADRPGSISNRFKTLAAVSIKFENRPGFASSAAQTATPLQVRIRLSSGEFCVGTVVTCVPMSSAQRTENQGLMRAAVAQSISGLAIE